MKNKNQTGLKNFKPKINLNHNIYMFIVKLQVTEPVSGCVINARINYEDLFIQTLLGQVIFTRKRAPHIDRQETIKRQILVKIQCL